MPPRFCRLGEVLRRRGEAVRRGDVGFTMIELIVTMSILILVMGIATGFIIGFQNQSTNVGGTVNGARQAQLASTALVQYLRATIQIAGDPPITSGGSVNTTPVIANAGADNLGVVADVGTATDSETPTLTAIYASYVAGGTGLPTGTGRLLVTFGCGTTTPPTTSSTTGCNSNGTKTVTTFYVLAPSQPIFTYYEYTPAPYTSPPNTSNVQGSIEALPSGFGSSCLDNIVAIGINASFFAGPEAVPTRGYAGDIATTLNTIVYLHNTVAYGTSPTTTTSTVTTTTSANSCYS